jgi:outer membrane protein assembly factor BamB
VLTVALLVVGALLLSSCDWPQFRGGPEHTGYASTETKIGVGNVGTLVEKWSATTGGTVHSSPAVVNGVVYVGSEDGKLYAFDATGGALQWTATTGGPVDSSPAVVNGVVYVGSGDGNLYAFDAAGSAGCSGTPKTCSPLWTAPTGSPVFSSPAVANEVVYVASGYPLTDAVWSPPAAKLYAFDATGARCSGTPKTCAPLWTGTPTGTFGTGSSPAASNGVVYVGSVSYGIVPISFLNAFDATTGAPLWTTPAGTVGLVDNSPAVANGTVYFPASPQLGNSLPTLAGYNAAGTTGCSGTAKTCSPVWTSAALGDGSIWWNSSPAVANGDVYVGGKPDCNGYGCDTGIDHNLYVFDATTGARLWAAPTGAQVLSSPAVSNGVVYVGSGDNKLYAFDAAKGTQLWTATTGGSVDSSPAVANGMVYVGSSDGKLHAYGLP